MRDLYNFQIGSRAAIYRLYRYSTPVGALGFVWSGSVGQRGQGEVDFRDFSGRGDHLDDAVVPRVLKVIIRWAWWQRHALTSTSTDLTYFSSKSIKAGRWACLPWPWRSVIYVGHDRLERAGVETRVDSGEPGPGEPRVPQRQEVKTIEQNGLAPTA